MIYGFRRALCLHFGERIVVQSKHGCVEALAGSCDGPARGPVTPRWCRWKDGNEFEMYRWPLNYVGLNCAGPLISR